MTTDEIVGFLMSRKNKTENNIVSIRFKKRARVEGVILRGSDYEYLKGKNFWRVIRPEDLLLWESTHSISLSRIFNGHDFKKLVDVITIR